MSQIAIHLEFVLASQKSKCCFGDVEVQDAGKIAFLVYGYGLGNSPSLINAAKMLVSEGYDVDFFTCGTYIGNLHFADKKIQIHEMQDPDRSRGKDFFSKVIFAATWRVKKLIRLLPLSYQVNNEETAAENLVLKYTENVLVAIGDTRYKFFIGVEPLGMMAARILSRKQGIPFAYYNMELHYGPDIVSTREFAIKNIEAKYNKDALFTITLDQERAKLIAAENGIDVESICTVPVCAEGEPFIHKTNEIRKRLGLSQEKKIVLYAGFLADWAMCAEMAEAAQAWPDDWVLVLHSHGYNDNDFIEKLKKYEGEKVLFSSSPVAYEELAGFLASADIGVALYKDLGLNFSLINSASGKLAHYLKSGLPVVVNSYPAVANVVDKYDCGVAVDGPEQMVNALQHIFNNYDEMRIGSFRCYDENYRFSRHFSKVVERINQLT